MPTPDKVQAFKDIAIPNNKKLEALWEKLITIAICGSIDQIY